MQLSALSPLDYFGSLVADDDHFALTEAVVTLAQDDVCDLDVQSVLAQIDELAERLKRRIPADAAPLYRLRALNRYFFNELAFAGNVNDFYNPANSFVHEVLRTRRGIPISLAVLYLEIAAHVGLQARGVSFPGHFLVKLHMPLGEVIIDPMSGRSLSREELDERLEPYRRRAGLVGDFEVPLGLFLRGAEPREIVARMLRNLQEIYRSADDTLRLLAVQNRLVVLLPEGWEERRDRGLTHAQLGQDDLAINDLRAYVETVAPGSTRLCANRPT
jgi:regulator of sirC expression with transglutaminase-like and TPR domain